MYYDEVNFIKSILYPLTKNQELLNALLSTHHSLIVYCIFSNNKFISIKIIYQF